MRTFATLQSRIGPSTIWQSVVLSGTFLVGALLFSSPSMAQSSSSTAPKGQQSRARQGRPHKPSKKQQLAATVAQTPPPPPMPNWPVNDKPNPASVVWDATGLRIDASNSSLQQILSEVSTETGSKVEGMGADQRVYGDYGPGQARDVLSQLLQGSGYNVLLAGDIGQGAPREIVLSPRQSGSPGAASTMSRTQLDPDEDIPEPPEEQPQPLIQPPQSLNPGRPGFGPNGPVRTPQQVMEEMQQRQLLQQQQMQQQQIQQQQIQQQQAAPQTNPQ